MKRLKKLLAGPYKAIKSRVWSTWLFENFKFWRYHDKFLNVLPTPIKGENIAKKPVVINFNANDICNSKCVMCNIWQQKQTYEVSPEDLFKILSNDLYRDVKYVGVTGGEPTLREDLVELYDAVIRAIPGIKGLSIITNAIKEADVISRIENVLSLCQSRRKTFSMMVSIDGVGEVHDLVRRREGNFVTALNVLEHFKSKVDITIGCTISKVNVWDVDDLLFFVKKNNFKARFRIAEFIKRLYNEHLESIRSFDEDEVYHLVLFFMKLNMTYEKNQLYRNTYRSIINQLLGGNRLIGCPYQEGGIVLNSRGELAYCAPKSNIIGNGLSGDSELIYMNNLEEKRHILDSYCKNCIHDYHSNPTREGELRARQERFWQKHLSLYSKTFNALNNWIIGRRVERNKSKSILILGWYGTETVGDKAILGGIVEELMIAHQGSFELTVASIYPFITVRTLRELGISGKVIASYSREFVECCCSSTIVIMGGGPLMDLDDLAIPLRGFQIAHAFGAKTIVYGCGLGPLSRSVYKSAVRQIIQLADSVRLRDNSSLAYVRKELRITKEIEVVNDPAKSYVLRFARKAVQRNVLCCFLREWTYEYNTHLSQNQFDLEKMKFESALAAFIKAKAEDLGVEEIHFEHMHNFVVGNDDRDFSRAFLDRYFSDYDVIPYKYNKRLSTVESITTAMLQSRFNICMRFHSVVFAHTLNTSFVAVDYTNGGKILNYLSDNNALERLLTVEALYESVNNPTASH